MSPGAAAVLAACELVLSDPRSGAELQRLALPAPELVLAFEHSVLGTPVADRYVFRRGAGDAWRAHLVEERFEGQGYGLPHAAGAGETLVRDGPGWRLGTDREVHPLVVRTLPAQRMRLVVAGREWPLAQWSATAVALQVQGCP